MVVRVVVRKNDLPAIVGGLDQRMHRAVVESTMRLQAGISAATTSGRFRRGLARKITRPSSGWRGEIQGVWWWYFREYGTRHQSAQPAVHPAAEAERHRFIGAVRDAVLP